MSVLRDKFQEVISSVLPVTLFVVVLQLLFRPLDGEVFGQFLFAALIIIFGLGIFLLGVDVSITPIGSSLSRGIVKNAGIKGILLAAFAMGFLINIAEPDLMILARNIETVTEGGLGYAQLMVMVSLGVGLLVMVGFARLLKQLKLNHIFLVAYLAVFILAIFSPGEYLAIAFDACGATTGAITTPFLLALATGIAAVSHEAKRDGAESFGMVGLASSGAIIAVLVLGIFSKGGELIEPNSEVLFTRIDGGFFAPFRHAALPMLKSALMAILPLSIIFFLVNSYTKETRKREYGRILVGLTYCIVGLTIFTIGVEGGFMSTGSIIARHIALEFKPWYLVPLGFFLGMTTVLAEPAVHVLTKQIQEQTVGAISNKLVMLFLSGGVAIAVALAMVRILFPGLRLWYILLPVYIFALGLSFINSELFTGIAFDSGGVVSGPMTATFVLAFAQGAAAAMPEATIVHQGYGVIALVATSPLISLQLLGLIYKVIDARNREENDESPA